MAVPAVLVDPVVKTMVRILPVGQRLQTSLVHLAEWAALEKVIAYCSRLGKAVQVYRIAWAALV